MAMSKKEQDEMSTLVRELAVSRALAWTAPVERDLPAPTGSNRTSGWDFNVHNHTVYEAWSESTRHGMGPAPSAGRSGSQRGVAIFSTKERALRALRHSIERSAAELLASIDQRIGAAMREADVEKAGAQ
jgi:hypothetical protein